VGGGCNVAVLNLPQRVAVPDLPRREVGRAGVYWLALGPSARTSGGRLGTATLQPPPASSHDHCSDFSERFSKIQVYHTQNFRECVVSHTLLECVGNATRREDTLHHIQDYACRGDVDVFVCVFFFPSAGVFITQSASLHTYAFTHIYALICVYMYFGRSRESMADCDAFSSCRGS